MDSDTFPYKRYSLPASPMVYFKRAQAYRSTVEEKVLRSAADEARLLRADSVVSRTSRQAFLHHFPLHYITPERQPRRAVVIRTPRGAYDAINVFPDYYTEDARVRDTGAYQKVSPFDFWNEHQQEIEAKVQSDDRRFALHEQRELLWKIGPKEARQGKITNYLTLFSLLKSRVVLDPSAAWGDRLIAALASSSVEAYTGVDPHSRLPRGWREILEELGPLSGKPNYKERFVMLNEPFEPADATPLPEGMGKYDTVLISTSPLEGDSYDKGNPNQAVAKYGSSYKSYVVGFLIPYLRRAIEALCVGGYLCMTVLDRARSGYYITELQLLLTELLAGQVMEYTGAVFWEGDSGGLVPWWIFVKRGKPISEQRQREARQLFAPYIEITL
jgi:hypothetical protein